MATYINDDGDSFININDFDSDDNGANITELYNNDRDPTIPLSNTPLKTIFEEDKGGDGPEFGPKPKNTRRGTRILSIRQRIQGLYQLKHGDPLFKVIKDSGVLKPSLYKIRERRQLQVDGFLVYQ